MLGTQPVNQLLRSFKYGLMTINVHCDAPNSIGSGTLSSQGPFKGFENEVIGVCGALVMI